MTGSRAGPLEGGDGEDEDEGLDGALSDSGAVEMGKKWVA